VTRALAGADVDVTVVDRTNHHLFQPLLFQVAPELAMPYDTLVVASGAADAYFGHQEWAEFPPGIKTLLPRDYCSAVPPRRGSCWSRRARRC
jgi:NADH dehydrogenase